MLIFQFLRLKSRVFYLFQWPTREPYPYPSYTRTFAQIFVGLLAFFTVLSFTFIIPPIMKRIVQEKKSGAKELMKMMGLPTWMNWFFHFLDAVASVMFTLVIVVILLGVEWKAGQGR